MKNSWIVIVTMGLAACAPLPYEDLARGARWDVRYVAHDARLGMDQKTLGCPATGDCDDRAMCAACRLIQQGADPAEITVVVQGWNAFDTRSRHNHMALEYKGMCLMGLGADATVGKCKHPYADSAMRTVRTPLPEYLRKHGATNNCAGV